MVALSLQAFLMILVHYCQVWEQEEFFQRSPVDVLWVCVHFVWFACV